MPAQHVLVPIDFSPYADQALVYAIEVAKSLNAYLTLLHVLQVPLVVGDSEAVLNASLESLEAEAEQGLQAALERIRQAALKGESVMVAGVPFQTIVQVARDQHADLIVMGTHGRTGLTHILIGSVAEKVVRLAPCPVLVTRPHEDAATPHILVPLDFSADADYALEIAVELAQKRQARMSLLHVIDRPPMGPGEIPLSGSYQQEVLTAVDQHMTRTLVHVQQTGLKADMTIRRGNPLQTILEVAHSQNIDLIVMGTRGRTGFKRVLLGSVAENVVRLAPCPVMVTHRREDSLE